MSPTTSIRLSSIIKLFDPKYCLRATDAKTVSFWHILPWKSPKPWLRSTSRNGLEVAKAGQIADMPFGQQGWLKFTVRRTEGGAKILFI